MQDNNRVHVSAFNPRAFFGSLAESQDTPSSTKEGGEVIVRKPLQEFTLELPTTGLIAIGNSHFDDAWTAWIAGLYTMSEEQALFTSQMAQGDIPTRSVRQLNSDLPSSRLISQYRAPSLSSPPLPLWSILQVGEDLFQAAIHSTHRICTHCKATVPILSDVATLQSAILQDWSQQFARIYLCGQEDLYEWAASLGLQLSDSPPPLFTGIEKAILLDATEITSNTLVQLRQIVAGALRFSGSTVWVSNSNRSTAYSANGMCAACGIDGERLTRVTLTRRLTSETVDSVLCGDSCLSRVIGDRPLSTLITAPISALLNAPSLPLSSLAETLTQVHLGDLSLLSTSDEIGESGCALARIASELLRSRSTAVTILDSPFHGMSHEDTLSLQSLLESQSTSRLLVMLRTFPKREYDTEDLPKTDFSVPCESLGATLAVNAPHLNAEYVIPIGETHFSIFSPARNLSTPFSRSLRALPNDLGNLQVEIVDTPLRSTSSLVIDELGWYEGLCKIFAASHAARMNGFTPQTFKRTATRADALVCQSCKGFGVLLKRKDRSVVDSSPCPSCRGHRFADAVASIQFRGRTVWEILSASIEVNRNLIRTIPRATPLIDTLSIVGLTYLPIGLPSELLTPSEQILLQCAVAAVPPSNGSRRLVFCSHPTSTLSSQETAALLQLVKSTDPKRVRWCFESDDPQLKRLLSLG